MDKRLYYSLLISLMYILFLFIEIIIKWIFIDKNKIKKEILNKKRYIIVMILKLVISFLIIFSLSYFILKYYP